MHHKKDNSNSNNNLNPVTVNITAMDLNNVKEHNNNNNDNVNSSSNNNDTNKNPSSSSDAGSYIYRRIDTMEELKATAKNNNSHNANNNHNGTLKLQSCSCHFDNSDSDLVNIDSFSESSESSSSGIDTNIDTSFSEANIDTNIDSNSDNVCDSGEECEMLLLHHDHDKDQDQDQTNEFDFDLTTSEVTAKATTTTTTSGTDNNAPCKVNSHSNRNNKSTTIHSTTSRKTRKFNHDMNKNTNNNTCEGKQMQKQRSKEAEEEIARRAQKRQMTSTQELWNAISIIPSPLYCLYFCLSGAWLTQSDIHNSLFGNADDMSMDMNFNVNATQAQIEQQQQQYLDEWASSASSTRCIHSSFLPNLHSLPPLTVISATIACGLHAPCSMYYHLLCAYKLPPGPKRMDHWARRLDQAMIHFMSFLYAYTTSANTDYLLATMAFNIDCMYRLFQKEMRPKRTLYRMIVAFCLPVLPIVSRGEFWKAFQLLMIYTTSGWLFSAYPFGGWSHCAFHFVVFFSNPILLQYTSGLDAHVVRDSIDLAARCALIWQNGSDGGGDVNILI